MRIELLYPEVCNLYGDLRNVEYLRRSCPGIEVVTTDLHSEPYFARGEADMVYMGTTTENSQLRVIEALKPYKDVLKKAIDDGLNFFFTGNAHEVLGEYIKDGDQKIECLGILPVYAVRDMMHRYNSLWIGSFKDEAEGVDNIDIVGFKSQFTQSYITDESFKDFLFTAERGDGFNPSIKGEGMRIRNMFVTYLLGPIFIINPIFTKYYLKHLGFEDAVPAYEEAALASYNKRVKEFRDPNRGFTY